MSREIADDSRGSRKGEIGRPETIKQLVERVYEHYSNHCGKATIELVFKSTQLAGYRITYPCKCLNIGTPGVSMSDCPDCKGSGWVEVGQ